MPNDEVKLLPCPLCNVELFHNGGTELGDIYEHPNNGCAMQVAWFTATPEWVAKWNRRTASPSIGRVGALEQAARAGWEKGRRSWCPASVLEDQERTERDWAMARPSILSTLVYHEEPAGDTQGAVGVGDEKHAVGEVDFDALPLLVRIQSVLGDPVVDIEHHLRDVEGLLNEARDVLAALVSPPDNGEARAAVLEEAAKVADRLAAYWSALPDDQIEVARKLAAHDVAVAIRALAGRAALQSHNEGRDGK